MGLANIDADAILPGPVPQSGVKRRVSASARTDAALRQQSVGEELANSVSHGVALLAAVVGIPFLLGAVDHPKPFGLVGPSVFVVTMVAVYLSSTVYHALPVGRSKHLFLKLDRSAIYLFIAGSYTPFALGVLAGPRGWAIFALIWLLAAVGVTLTVYDRISGAWPSTALYLVMGWLVLLVAAPLIELTPARIIFLLVAGGISYTAGVAFFLLDSRLPYAHAIWHVFVIGGTTCHYFAVLNCDT
jgi:hemolysin III